MISGQQDFFFKQPGGQDIFFPPKCSAGYFFFFPHFSAGFFFLKKESGLHLHHMNFFEQQNYNFFL